jgi:hypothetical protein
MATPFAGDTSVVFRIVEREAVDDEQIRVLAGWEPEGDTPPPIGPSIKQCVETFQ